MERGKGVREKVEKKKKQCILHAQTYFACTDVDHTPDHVLNAQIGFA